MEKIGFAGSFDPLTKGHMWVIEQGLELAQEVWVFLAVNPSKKGMFSMDERKALIESTAREQGWENRVKVLISSKEFVAQRALEEGCTHMIRGVRSAVDFDYERQLEKTNAEALNGAKTLFVMPPANLESVSSSFVKSMIGPVGWVNPLRQWVSKSVHQALVLKFMEHEMKQVFQWDDTCLEVKNFMKAMKKSYMNPSRNYHDLGHVAHMWSYYQWMVAMQVKMEIHKPEQMMMAIVGHDWIQGNQKSQFQGSDEHRSAMEIKAWIHQLGLMSNQEMQEVILAIEKTAHFKPQDEQSNVPVPQWIDLFLDLDMEVLSQNEKGYEQYAKGVELEYVEGRQVPRELYVEGRKQALESLMKQTIYRSEYFKNKENKAKENMEKEWEFWKKQS